jgi:hypothetical protein
MKLPNRVLWELVIPSEKPSHAPADVVLYHEGGAALTAFVRSPEGAILRPVTYRLTPDTKALALAGKAHYLAIMPMAMTAGRDGLVFTMPAAEDADDRIQKIGLAIDGVLGLLESER